MNEKRVIKVSKAWIAAFALGLALTGCGGGGSGGSDSSASNSAGANSSASAEPGKGSSANSEGTTESEAAEESRSAVLSWSAPATRVNGDGIAMGELDKYVIRYGQNIDDLNEEIVLEGADSYPEMSHTVENLDTGDWYFTIQVQDKQGLISEPSEPVSKTIQS